MLLARPTLMRTSARSVASLGRNPSQQFARRTYAASHEVKKSSDLPWAITSIGVSIPAIYYIYQTGQKEKGHHEHKADEH
ncbi:hypothetical protein BJX68DRAFT_268115 [Aspergillus pseudodeflectus]|uniref:Uncharacterized protein n=1 Tax=Aspergillus pseudodeflectus TaxID=176178 RepID=A0ABR4K5Y8_9EURO